MTEPTRDQIRQHLHDDPTYTDALDNLMRRGLTRDQATQRLLDEIEKAEIVEITSGNP